MWGFSTIFEIFRKLFDVKNLRVFCQASSVQVKFHAVANQSGCILSAYPLTYRVYVRIYGTIFGKPLRI